jgi:hypothetical protein
VLLIMFREEILALGFLAYGLWGPLLLLRRRRAPVAEGEEPPWSGEDPSPRSVPPQEEAQGEWRSDEGGP